MDYKKAFHLLRKSQRKNKNELNRAGSGLFVEKIFEKTNWCFDFGLYELGNSLKLSSKIEKLDNSGASEKEEVLSSFAEFAHQEIEVKNDESKLSFEGGEVQKKKSEQGNSKIKAQNERIYLVEQRDSLSDYCLIEDYQKEVAPLVVFVGETPKDFDPENSQNDLLSKMISAMKFDTGQTIRIFIQRSEDKLVQKEIWDEVARDLYFLKPSSIVSLGAYATNLCLKKKEKLSQVHGKSFNLIFEEKNSKEGRSFSAPCFPVFHPDILQINPNMKRSAWLDLQRIMEYLGKKV